jgi:uncharacterized protein (TIGR02594 family)
MSPAVAAKRLRAAVEAALAQFEADVAAAPTAAPDAAPWMIAARAKIGVRETPGEKNTPAIMKWASSLGSAVLGIAYGADSVPWCGLFVAQCIAEAGLKPPKIAVRAKAWATWGEASEPCEGAVLVFERPGGGHVGFYAGENKLAYRVLGGNQGDAVSYAWIEKSRCIAVRWPAGYLPKGVVMTMTGSGQLSTNEA